MRLSRLLAADRSTPHGLANFDSTTVFVRATASYLRGEEFPALGLVHPKLTAATPLLNRLPRRVRTSAYTWGGANEGTPPGRLGDVDVEAFRRWVTERYPARGYPAVLIGSSNGAAVFLAALLGIPWLPQTFLVPVRRSLHPDAIREDAAWGARHAGPFLAANPDVALHQMHDPNQDRLMVRRLAYFRTKSRRLGEAYEEFLGTVLEPGGTVVTVECGYEWPAVDLGDRHTYQVGGLGGLAPREYYDGSERIARFLAARGADRRTWDTPDPDGTVPEAEWGFDPALREDVERLADERGYEVRRLSFDDPRELSAFVADCYRRRYAERGRPSGRLLVQSFALVEPWWTLRTGSVPYWAAFNTRPDVRRLESYLDGTRPYDDVRATLFSHGVESAGFAPASRWRAALDRARERSGFVGVDPAAYPYDVETLVRYHADLPDEIRARRAHPPPLSFERFDALAADLAAAGPVEWRDG
ncbi:hypothetical protein [Salinilacihabitans rarus]|uniref:hypothetical protein n=1 Tax=Salinilacihabitans rarus TaxID=2961596 RepID=UPI0020C85BC1|nr:hypothetical protein [Salinilacihabitans rarus]